MPTLLQPSARYFVAVHSIFLHDNTGHYFPRLAVVAPACCVRADIVVFTLFIAVCIDSLFFDAGPSDTWRAFSPKARAAPLSYAAACVGETVTIISVFELPPSESCSSVVSSELPYGICFFPCASAPTTSCSARIEVYPEVASLVAPWPSDGGRSTRSGAGDC